MVEELKLAPDSFGPRHAVLLALLVAAAVATVLVHASDGVSEQVLGGETDQGRQVRLHLDEKGRARGLDTHVETICKGGHRWSADWTPREGDATFRQRGGRLVVREVVERPDELGRIERIGALMTGHVEGTAPGESSGW
jgi:hypothetical protein